MNYKLIRIHEVLNRTGFCGAWIYQLVKQKRFPEPIKIGERAIHWDILLLHFNDLPAFNVYLRSG